MCRTFFSRILLVSVHLLARLVVYLSQSEVGVRYERAERSGDINQGFHHVLVPPRVEFQPALVQFVFWITASDGFKVEKRENTHTHFQYTFHLSCVCVSYPHNNLQRNMTLQTGRRELKCELFCCRKIECNNVAKQRRRALTHTPRCV